jgi:hypothetical protein
MPPRLLRLFARVAGAEPVRRWQTSHVKPVQIDEKRGVEVLRRSSPAMAAQAAPAAGGAPAAGAAPPAAPAPAPEPAPVDKAQIAKLIAALSGRDGETARKELVAITHQDFGTKTRRWEAWWEKHQDDDRVEWLFEGLAHKEPHIRAAAESALRKLTGEYVGYHFDLPRREREQARARWQAWWYASGRARKKT